MRLRPWIRRSASAGNGTVADSRATGRDVGALSRRKLFGQAAGAVAIGAVAESALAGTASPALAASPVPPLAGGRTAEPGLAPVVVQLTQRQTIAVDAALGNDFRVTLTGNYAMGNPSHPLDGEKITFQITQGDDGPFTVTWGSAYHFPEGQPRPVLSTKAGRIDMLGFVYNAARAKWLFAGYMKGFS
jgi:hypothetical protein